MAQVREILRLTAEGLSGRIISKSLRIARQTVADTLTRAKAAGLSWPLPAGMDEAQLEARLFPHAPQPGTTKRPEPDWGVIHREMQRKGATLLKLYEEYLSAHPNGFSYPHFCYRYRQFCGGLRKYLRRTYAAGERVSVDYAGLTVPVHDLETGQKIEAQIFIGVLGASQYTFAEAHPQQTLANWIAGNVRMLEFFDGAPDPSSTVSVLIRRILCEYSKDFDPRAAARPIMCWQ